MSIRNAFLQLVIATQVLAQAPGTLIPGSYMRSSYIRSVSETGSPFKSIGKGGVLEIVVSKEGDKTILSPIFSFHDSGTTYYLDNNHRLTPLGGGKPQDILKITIKSSSSFSIPQPNDFRGEYEYVGSADDFLRSHTIAGNYVDQQGRKYVLGANGSGVFPGRKFSYQVGCDHFDAPFDYLYGPGLYWAFLLTGDTLQLYECNENGPGARKSKPFLTIKRVPK